MANPTKIALSPKTRYADRKQKFYLRLSVMVTFRVQYKDGQFTPLDDVSTLPDGITLELVRPPRLPTPDEIQEMLNRTQGAWTDIDEDVEGFLEQARQIWDEQWQERLKSL